MTNKITTSAIATFILLFSIPSSAQILSGFGGKRTVIKTDILNGNGLGFRNIDLEVLLHPNFTLGVAYRKYSNDKVKQITLSDDNYFSIYTQNKRATVDFGIIEFTARYYLTTSLVPAPHGAYLFFSHGRGSGTVKGHNYNESLNSNFNNILVNEPYIFDNVEFRNFQIGIGKQKVLNHYFTIDYGCSIGRNKLVNSINKAVLSSVGPFVGEHFMSSSFWKINESPNVVSTFDIDSQFRYNGTPSMRNIALFLYFKLGIMLF